MSFCVGVVRVSCLGGVLKQCTNISSSTSGHGHGVETVVVHDLGCLLRTCSKLSFDSDSSNITPAGIHVFAYRRFTRNPYRSRAGRPQGRLGNIYNQSVQVVYDSSVVAPLKPRNQINYSLRWSQLSWLAYSYRHEYLWQETAHCCGFEVKCDSQQRFPFTLLRCQLTQRL